MCHFWPLFPRPEPGLHPRDRATEEYERVGAPTRSCGGPWTIWPGAPPERRWVTYRSRPFERRSACWRARTTATNCGGGAILRRCPAQRDGSRKSRDLPSFDGSGLELWKRPLGRCHAGRRLRPVTLSRARLRDLCPLLGSVVALFLVHAPVLLRYGLHRDEMYFVECGKHLSAGYVDHPPFVPLMARIACALGGCSLLTLRLAPLLVRMWKAGPWWGNATCCWIAIRSTRRSSARP
jgi:hypothetical protein